MDSHPWLRRAAICASVLCAAFVAVAVGMAAITTVGAQLRGRGPLGPEVMRPDALTAEAIRDDPGSAPVRRVFADEYGTIEVECRGAFATTVAVHPDPAQGWRLVSFEPGPDDDVDIIFTKGPRAIDVEIFCNRGRPTVAEVERTTLPRGWRPGG